MYLRNPIKTMEGNELVSHEEGNGLRDNVNIRREVTCKRVFEE